MRHIKLALISILAIPAAAMGQRAMSWNTENPINDLYNPKTVVTFNGKITGQVVTEAGRPGGVEGSALLVKANNGGTARVHMGPQWYMENQKQKLNVGDKVTITGSKVSVNGMSQILAQKIVKNSKVMYLREMTGYPMWISFRGQLTAPRDMVPVANLQTAGGRVVAVETITNGQDGVPSTALLIENENGQTYTVDLGPAWYINRQPTQFAVGDNITFTYGSMIRVPGPAPVYIANEVMLGNQVLVLRYENGRPVWRVWG